MHKLLAKSQPIESIEVHTKNLLTAFNLLKHRCLIDSIEKYYTLIEKILWYHDTGKANLPFQNRLRKHLKLGSLAKTTLEYYPHEWLSPSFIIKEDKELFKSYNKEESNINFLKLARYCIAFHHSRMYEPDSEKIKKQLNDIQQNQVILKTSELEVFAGILKLKQNIESPEYWPHYFKYVALFKGILHKCDYAASAGIDAEIEYIGDYRKHFERKLPFPIAQLTEQQIEAKELSDKNIIYIASTGAGKTEYSMNWINGDKAFYLLGLRTAVEAMYKRFKSMFAFDNEHDDNVALLHGESIYRLLEENEQDYGINDDEDILHKHSRIKLLSSPITVATADQLVTSVFKFPGFEFFYFTASYSKIVIDEIQSFSPEAIASIVVFLKEVHQLGAKFLLMTATLPPFVEEDLKDIIGLNTIVKRCYFSDTKRHVIEPVQETLDDNKAKGIISEAWRNNIKILMISNTVAGAQELAERYAEYDPQVLHSRFTRKDRKEKEEAILNETKLDSRKNKPVLWISTQIVEASLDIDFDILLTEYATIDALFQRFGRCWRRRRYDSSGPNIYIFVPKDKKATSRIYDDSLTEITWNILQNYSGQLITEELKQDIIEKIFEDIKDNSNGSKYYKKYKEYKDLLQLGLRAGNKSEAEKYFRNITNNYNVIPEPVFIENKIDIEQLLQVIDDKSKSLPDRFKAKKELFGFTVPVQLYEKKRRELLKDIPVENDNLRKLTQKLDIWLLKGVNYSYEKGAEFDKDYKDNNNFIL